MAVKKELIKKFAIEYATLNTQHSLKWWGERYGVSGTVIGKWLSKIFVKDIIEKETKTFGDIMREKAQKNAQLAMRELKKLVKSDKHTDVKRKACIDMLGLCDMKNVNKEDHINNNIQNKNYIKMSNKDIEKEYDQLLGRHKRKKRDTPNVETSVSKTIN